MNIHPIVIPITWTILCILAVGIWPPHRRRGDYDFDVTPILVCLLSIIAALIGWVAYLAIRGGAR